MWDKVSISVSQLKLTRRCHGSCLHGFIRFAHYDHFGFTAKIDTQVSIFYAAHIPGNLGILPSLELRQYHPQPFFIQCPTIGIGIILPPLLSL